MSAPIHSTSLSTLSRPGAATLPSARCIRWAVPGHEGLAADVMDCGRPGGVTLVFLHGLVGLNEHWEEVVGRVSGDVRCILFEVPLLDLRGDACSIHGATEITARFLRDYLTEPAVLVGNSFGGHVAARVAIEHPHFVRGLVLTGASGLIEKSIVADVQIRPSREWMERKIGELFYDQRFMRPADVDRAHKALSERGGARAMVKLSRSARRDHLGDRMREIRVPTLLVWGRQDVVTPPEAAEGFKRYIPHSRLVWLDDCGHAPMIEKADDFAREVLAFAAAFEGAGGGGGGPEARR